MELGLRGKTALITGGGSGIGRGIATVLAEEGVDLAIASRNPDPADAVDNEVRHCAAKPVARWRHFFESTPKPVYPAAGKKPQLVAETTDLRHPRIGKTLRNMEFSLAFP